MHSVHQILAVITPPKTWVGRKVLLSNKEIEKRLKEVWKRLMEAEKRIKKLLGHLKK